MYIQGFFKNAQTYSCDIYDVDGYKRSTENVHLTRQGIANNDFAQTHKYKGLLAQDTLMQSGDLVTYGVYTYLVTAVRRTDFANQANLWLCDSTCAVYRLENKYVGNQITGKKLTTIATDIKCVQQDTNGRIKTFDAGLLENTIKRVYMQYSANVKLLDRMTINNKNYQIDSIDDSSISNVMCVQLSEDKRVISG